MMPDPSPPPCVVIAQGLAFPEGPAFAPDGALWCVELKGGVLVRIDDGGIERFPVGGEPNGLAFDHLGRAWFCDAAADAIRRFDPSDGSTETVVAADGLDRPNDLAFGPAGELLFTCPGNSRQEPTGKVWHWRPGEGPALVADGLYFPNGLAFTPDGAQLVIAETYRHRLWRGGWADGAWQNPQPFAVAGGPIGPDGMAHDRDGVLHVAVYGQGVIRRLAPDGSTLASWATPGPNPTNCAFDPSGRLGLVVTEAGRGEILSFAPAAAGAPLYTGLQETIAP
jgi:gluconolactonase